MLLDALEVLGPHRDRVVLVGAQAVFFHTGESDLAVAPHTTNGDLALDARGLAPESLLAEALLGAGFRNTRHPGLGIGRFDVQLDLLVPESLGGLGRRGARLGVHGNSVAREHLAALFGALDSPGSQMAGRAVESLDDPERIIASCAALTTELLGLWP